MSIFNDPLLYINWGAAIIGIYLIWRYGRELEKAIDNHLKFAIYFILLSIAVGGCMYISQRAGDIQIQKMIDSKGESK